MYASHTIYPLIDDVDIYVYVPIYVSVYAYVFCVIVRGRLL
jgi:hypothetical protein